MPTIEQQPRRPSSTRSGKSSSRPHSRSSSKGPLNHGFGGFTTIAPTTQAAVVKTERPKAVRKKSGGTMSTKHLSPERDTLSPQTRPGIKQQLSDTAKPKVKIDLATNGGGDDEEGDWESSESGAVTPNPDPSNEDNTAAESTRELAAALQNMQLHEQLQQQQMLQLQQGQEQQRRQQQQQATRQPLPPHPDERTPSPPRRRPAAFDLSIATGRTPSPRDLQSRLQPTNPAAETNSHGNQHHAHHHHHHHYKQPIPHHPLIRAPAYATSPVITVPPYLSAQSAQAQMQNIPGSSPLAASPPDSPLFSVRPLNARKGSFSSTHSAATLPIPGTATSKHNALALIDPRRERTMSSLSTLSAANALSSLAGIHYPSHPATPSRPPTPPVSSRFPLSGPDQNIHPLLPLPYLSTHLTVLKYYDPLQDSFARVATAKVKSQVH